MFSWINIPFLFALVQAIVLVRAQYSTETCVEEIHQKKSAELLCSGGLISDVSLQSGTGKCLNADGRCLGMTPSLLVDQNNCYWQSECVVNWPREPIVSTGSDRKSKTCIGRIPTFMSIRYKCFKPTDRQEDDGLFSLSDSDVQPKRPLIDVCSDSNGGKWSAYSDVVGIIRSHKLYPWDYSNKPRNCSVTLYWPVTQNLMLFVTVKSIDLSETDRLVIGNGHGKYTNVMGSRSYKFSNQKITAFNFTVGADSNSGQGFLLCFRFRSNTDKSSDNACDSIMTDGIVNNTEPAADDPSALHVLKESWPAKVASSQVPSMPDFPKRCKKRKTEAKRRKCAANIKKRKGKNTKRNKERNNKKRNRKGKRDRRKRRHSVRRHT